LADLAETMQYSPYSLAGSKKGREWKKDREESKEEGRVGLKWRSFIILFFSGCCSVSVPVLYNCGEGAVILGKQN